MEPLNPVEIEAQLRKLTTRISKGIGVYAKAYGAFLDADRAFAAAYARAYLEAEGPVKDREMRAKADTLTEREARDVQELAYKHADKLLKALELELRTLQSIGASVRAAYQVAGRGE